MSSKKKKRDDDLAGVKTSLETLKVEVAGLQTAPQDLNDNIDQKISDRLED